MKQEFINEGIKKLNNVGLNILATIKVKELPPDIIATFQKQNIAFDLDDTLWIIAQGGKILWNQIRTVAKVQKDPIDTFSINQMLWFSKTVLNEDIKILYPTNAFNIPLQKIGRIVNISAGSPLGIDINPNFGLWFAFRGLFLAKNNFAITPHKNFISPCETCTLKPCISNCPANAISTNELFKINNCLNHRKEKNSNCKDKCLSRLVCPFKTEHQYDDDQIKYHATSSLLKMA